MEVDITNQGESNSVCCSEKDCCCRADNTERRIRDTLQQIELIKSCLATIENIINENPQEALTDFHNTARVKFYTDIISGSSQWMSRNIELLEREFLEVEEIQLKEMLKS